MYDNKAEELQGGDPAHNKGGPVHYPSGPVYPIYPAYPTYTNAAGPQPNAGMRMLLMIMNAVVIDWCKNVS